MFHGFLPVVGLLFVLAVVIAVVTGLLASKASPTTTFPYQKEPHLFSPAERSFLGVLEQAVGDQSRVLGKIRLADVIIDNIIVPSRRGTTQIDHIVVEVLAHVLS